MVHERIVLILQNAVTTYPSLYVKKTKDDPSHDSPISLTERSMNIKRTELLIRSLTII